jgi:hypothetical protein
MAVPVKLDEGTLEVGAPERLVDLSLAFGNNRASLNAPAANGQRFRASVSDRGLDAARHDLDELDGRHRQVARTCFVKGEVRAQTAAARRSRRGRSGSAGRRDRPSKSSVGNVPISRRLPCAIHIVSRGDRR